MLRICPARSKQQILLLRFVAAFSKQQILLLRIWRARSKHGFLLLRSRSKHEIVTLSVDTFIPSPRLFRNPKYTYVRDSAIRLGTGGKQTARTVTATAADASSHHSCDAGIVFEPVSSRRMLYST